MAYTLRNKHSHGKFPSTHFLGFVSHLLPKDSMDHNDPQNLQFSSKLAYFSGSWTIGHDTKPSVVFCFMNPAVVESSARNRDTWGFVGWDFTFSLVQGVNPLFQQPCWFASNTVLYILYFIHIWAAYQIHICAAYTKCTYHCTWSTYKVIDSASRRIFSFNKKMHTLTYVQPKPGSTCKNGRCLSPDSTQSTRSLQKRMKLLVLSYRAYGGHQKAVINGVIVLSPP